MPRKKKEADLKEESTYTEELIYTLPPAKKARKSAAKKVKQPAAEPEKPPVPEKKHRRPGKTAGTVVPAEEKKEAKPGKKAGEKKPEPEPESANLPEKPGKKRGRPRKQSYKDFNVDEELLGKSICIGDYYRDSGVIAEASKNGRGDISQVRACGATNDHMHAVMSVNILKSRDKRVRHMSKKYRQNSFGMDWICYAPTTDETVPEGIIRVFEKRPEAAE